MKVSTGMVLILVGLGLGLGMTTAQAAVVAVVSTKNPVAVLSRTQVTDIFLGRNNRFPDGRAAVPLDQAEGSVARSEFYNRYAGMSSPQVKAFWAKIIFTGRGQPPRAVANDDEVKKMLAANPRLIGYIDQKMVDSSVKVLVVP